MISINVHKAKTHLRICLNGKPVADIVPILEKGDPLQQNLKLQCIKIKYNPAEPLSEDEWPE